MSDADERALTPAEVAASVAAKSDQLNADDLTGGPVTVTVDRVRRGTSPEQPWDVWLVGRPVPWRPCKTMRRLLLALWGGDPSSWGGRRLTLHRDAAVKWGGEAVGGIRISHASGIGEVRRIALQATRQTKTPWTVHPLHDEGPDALDALLAEVGATVAQLDGWRASKSLPPTATLTPPQRAKLAAWLSSDRNADALEAVQLWRPTPSSAPTDPTSTGSVAPSGDLAPSPQEPL